MKKPADTHLLRLISRLNENRLTESEFQTLKTLLETDEAARLRYCEMQHQEAHLAHAALSNREQAETASGEHRRLHFNRSRWIPRAAQIAAILLIATTIGSSAWYVDRMYSRNQGPALAILRTEGISGAKRLHAGKVSLGKGNHVIDFFSGAQIQIQGRARFSIVDSMHIQVDNARFAANVNPEAKGFRIALKGASLVDLGTEFAVDIHKEGSSLKVFKGEVLANTTNPQGSTERSLLVTPINPLRFDARQNRYDPLTTEQTGFVSFTEKSAAPLPNLSQYQRVISRADPSVYWDFDPSENEGFVDQQKGRVLRTHGNHIARSLNRKNGALTFTADEQFHMAALDGELEFQKNQPFSIEFLFCPDRVRRATLMALFEKDSVQPNGSADHFILIETMARQEFLSHVPGAIRSAYRPVPSGNAMDGINSFSKQQYLPGQWVHFAMTFDGNELCTYLNSQLQNRLTLDPGEAMQSGRYAMVLGQAASCSVTIPPSETYRPFIGSIDELALYHRALNADEIAEHFRNLER